MEPTKSKKKKTARVLAHKYCFQPDNKCSYASDITYMDKAAFEEDRYRAEVQAILRRLDPAFIKSILDNPHIKPGSLRITFSFEE